jgi:hypothetical protein
MPTSTAIAIFAYRRPKHLSRAISALAACPEASGLPLIVYCDGPRGTTDAAAVAATVAFARSIVGFGEVRTVAQESNQGLARSVVTGVTSTLQQFERIVVLEDDLVVAPTFLTYTLTALDRYQAQPRVGAVHGYTPSLLGLPQHYFLRGGDCWGWATWRDRWPLYRADTADLISELHRRRLAARFDSTGGAGMYLRLLKAHRGEWDSWAIRWHASLFLADRLCLHPGQSLITNIGLDGSGTHGSGTFAGAMAGELTATPIDATLEIAENDTVRRLIARSERQTARGLMASLRSRSLLLADSLRHLRAPP